MTLKLPALAAAALALTAQTPGTYVLRDARVVRVSSPTIERASVVIRGGLIEAVGENVAAPPDAWVIDCKGLTVYPGLIDALSTWGMPSGGGGGRGAPPAKGPEDRPLNASWTKAADLMVPADRVLETVRNAGFTTAVVFPAGNIFSGQGSVINLAGDRAGQMVIADSVAQYVTLRTAGGRGGYPASLLGSIAYVRQIYLDADQYRAARAIYDKHPEGLPRPAYDRALEGVLTTSRVLLPADHEIEIARMLSLAKELKRNAVLYGGHEAWRATGLLQQAETPVLVSLKYPAKDRDADPAAEEPLRVLEFRDKAPSAAAALAQAKVKFAFYSDGLTNPRNLAGAMRKTIAAGLKLEDAVRALTLAPAEIYGVADRLGSIDKGKIANLVVTDGDLFAEKTKVRYTFVDGAKFEPLPEQPAQKPAAKGAER
jgi:imidazolonepropionase-like amidohydrolase